LRRVENFEIATVCIRRRSDGEVEDGSLVQVAVANIVSQVQIAMNNIIAKAPGTMVSTTHEVYVEIKVSYCPNLDIIDLPGLVSNKPLQVEQYVPKVTRDIDESVINSDKDFSIFLLVTSCNIPLNLSRSLGLLLDNGVVDKTIGVVTKYDQYVLDDDRDMDEIRDRTIGQDALRYLPTHGCYICASSTLKDRELAHVQRLTYTESQERVVLQKPMFKNILFNADGTETYRAGMPCIRKKVQNLFEDQLSRVWVPLINDYLSKEFLNLSDQNANLGLPIPNDIDYATNLNIIISTVRRVYPNYEVQQNLRVQTSGDFKDLLSKRVTEVCKNLDWLKFENLQLLWQEVALYRERLTNFPSEKFEIAIEASNNAKNEAAAILRRICECLYVFGATGPVGQKLITVVADREASKNFYFFRRALNFIIPPTDQKCVKLAVRFPELFKHYETYINRKITENCNAFREATLQNIDAWLMDPTMFQDIVYNHTPQGVTCSVSWSENAAKLPNIIISSWIENVAWKVKEATQNFELPPTSLNEVCKEQRLAVIRKMVDVVDVLNALKNLEEHVLREAALER
jgi:hypothetical protein